MSLKVLAFDTSTELSSAALMIDNHIVNACSGLSSCQHEKEILSMVNGLLLESGIMLDSLDFLVFCGGPGSFVGIRVGISLAQGLALGADLPLVQVSSLEVLSQGIWRLIKAKQVLATINAGAGGLYFSCYYRSFSGMWLEKYKQSIITSRNMSILISELHGKWVLVGTGWQRYPELFDSVPQIHLKKTLFPSAIDMLPIAIKKINSGNILSVDQIQPIYLSIKKWSE